MGIVHNKSPTHTKMKPIKLLSVNNDMISGTINPNIVTNMTGRMTSFRNEEILSQICGIPI